ncbi:Hpt domain-containing protein [Marimonas lutisalis]|uniref:Hpt domain-containing protein n=1 Tax=Marimonas lutisalis TaxID=2545756 RepID=UPI0010F7198E|nr:Hpt domain-containing protein [Marimonas lutisalis]
MIDWNKVSELRDEIGDEDFAEVVDLFLEEVDGAMEKLRNGLPEEKLECCLHFLKGSALNLGFRAFSELCARGESDAAAGDVAKIDLGQVVATYDASKEVFLSELAQRMVA